MRKAYQRERAPFSALTRMLGLAPEEVGVAELERWSEHRSESPPTENVAA